MLGQIQKYWRQLSFLFRLSAVLLLLFTLGRLILILLNPSQFGMLGGADYYAAARSGLKLDVATVCYFLFLPVLLMLSAQLFKKTFPIRMMRWYIAAMVFVVSAIELANARLYQSWGTPIDARAFAFLADFTELASSLDNFEIPLVIGLVVFLFLISFKVSRWVVAPVLIQRQHYLYSISVAVLAMSLLVTGMRGGLQPIPINVSDAFYSNRMELNHLALNPIYHLIHSLKSASSQSSKSFKVMADSEAQAMLEPVLKFHPNLSVLRTDLSHPNIVLIILESWTAGVIERLNGEKGVTPVFDSLAGEGLLFTNVYSSGFRTDQALPSIFSGFPAQPNNSVMRHLNKAAGLGSLVKVFNKADYQTTFLYGGDLGFSNMGAYLATSEFSKIEGEDKFTNAGTNKWGVHDEFLFEKLGSNLSTNKQPFFSATLTLSTHEPYDTPDKTPFDGADEAARFRSSAYYCDKQLGVFFSQAQKTDWYENTLFILIADHGKLLPAHSPYYSSHARHIPLLFVGPALKEKQRNSVCNTIGNSHDLATTLLAQLQLNHERFPWSRNLLSEQTVDFAYLTYDLGFGWIDHAGYHGYLPEIGVFGENLAGVRKPNDNDLKLPQAYLQMLYDQFIKL